MLTAVLESLAMGSIIAVGALGLTLTYGTTRFINFAYGDMVITAVYIFGVLWAFMESPVLVTILAALLTGVVYMLVAQAVFRPIRDRGPLPLLITSLGLGFMIRYTLPIVFGTFPKTPPFRFPVIEIAGTNIDSLNLVSTGVALVIFGAIFYLLNRTNLGAQMRAMSTNKYLSKGSGLEIEKMTALVWLVGISLAGICGLFFYQKMPISAGTGWIIMGYFFSAVLVGGIGRPKGAIVGGYIIGFTAIMGSKFFLPAYQGAYVFAILIITLAIGGGGLYRGLV